MFRIVAGRPRQRKDRGMIDDYGYGRYDDVVFVGCRNCIICNDTIMVRADAFSNEGLLCDECKKRLNELLYGADARGSDND